MGGEWAATRTPAPPTDTGSFIATGESSKRRGDSHTLVIVRPRLSPGLCLHGPFYRVVGAGQGEAGVTWGCHVGQSRKPWPLGSHPRGNHGGSLPLLGNTGTPGEEGESVQPTVTGDFPTPWTRTVRGLRGCREHEAGPGDKQGTLMRQPPPCWRCPRCHPGVRKPHKTWALYVHLTDAKNGLKRAHTQVPHGDLTATSPDKATLSALYPHPPNTDTGSPNCLPGAHTSLPSHREKPLRKRKLLPEQGHEMLLGDTTVLASRGRVTESSAAAPTGQRPKRAETSPPGGRSGAQGPPLIRWVCKLLNHLASVSPCGTGCSASLAVSHQR